MLSVAITTKGVTGKNNLFNILIIRFTNFNFHSSSSLRMDDLSGELFFPSKKRFRFNYPLSFNLIKANPAIAWSNPEVK